MRVFFDRCLSMRRLTTIPSFTFGPFNSSTQRRFLKQDFKETTQYRLQVHRTKDTYFDELSYHIKRLNIALEIHDTFKQFSNHYASLEQMSKWVDYFGLHVPMTKFLRNHHHVFDVFTHPVKQYECCKLSQTMVDLIQEEEVLMRQPESVSLAVKRVKKLLLMSVTKTLEVSKLSHFRFDLGLPDNFVNSVFENHVDVFVLDGEGKLVELTREQEFSSSRVMAKIEKWRERERIEKWLSKHDTRYAFPIQFPMGFKLEPEYKTSLEKWQMLKYAKPYEKKKGAEESHEKRAVGVIHELLCLTVEKTMLVERLSQFVQVFGIVMDNNDFVDILLKHPGIFYVCTRGGPPRVYLREAYCEGRLLRPNPIYNVRRKMLSLVLLRDRETWRKPPVSINIRIKKTVKGDAHWVLPMLDSLEKNIKI